MRVLMMSWEYPPHVVGGLARHVYHLSVALSQQGIEVHVLTCGDDQSPLHATERGVHVHRVRPHRLQPPGFVPWVLQMNVAFLEESVRLAEDQGPFDLIHAHDWLVALAARATKHLYRLPLVATIHAAEHGRHGGLHTPEQHYISQVEWELTYEAWKVILCSQYMKDDLASFFGLPPEKVEVIPNGVVVGPQRNYLPLGQRKPLILFVGRLVPEKGVATLLEAMPLVLESHPAAWCVVAGTGPAGDELQALSTRLGVAERVVFAGYVDDATLNSLYRTAQLAVFPSLYEPFGIVALEAMAHGAATVVADTGGLAEIVEHEVNGLISPAGRADALAERIIHLLNHPEIGQSLVDNAYHRLLEQYSWSNIARQTDEIYRQVGEEHGAGEWKKGRRPRSFWRPQAWGQKVVEHRGGGSTT